MKQSGKRVDKNNGRGIRRLRSKKKGTSSTLLTALNIPAPRIAEALGIEEAPEAEDIDMDKLHDRTIYKQNTLNSTASTLNSSGVFSSDGSHQECAPAWKETVRRLSTRGINVGEILELYTKARDLMPEFDPQRTTTRDVVRSVVIPLSKTPYSVLKMTNFVVCKECSWLFI